MGDFNHDGKLDLVTANNSNQRGLGNFKNKLSGTADRCMLSVPTVITGAAYNFHSLSDGGSLETTLLFEGAPVVIRLDLHS